MNTADINKWFMGIMATCMLAQGSLLFVTAVAVNGHTLRFEYLAEAAKDRYSGTQAQSDKSLQAAIDRAQDKSITANTTKLEYLSGFMSDTEKRLSTLEAECLDE